MKINGYDINYDEAELKDKMENQTFDVRLISPDFEGYKNLSEGNKKLLRIWLPPPVWSMTWRWNRTIP